MLRAILAEQLLKQLLQFLLTLMTHSVKLQKMQVKLQDLKYFVLSTNQLLPLLLTDLTRVKTQIKRYSYMTLVAVLSMYLYLRLVTAYLKFFQQMVTPVLVEMTSIIELSTFLLKSLKRQTV